MIATGYYFATPESREKLRDEALSWVGTPFIHMAAVKHGGVDCVQLVGQVMTALQLVASYQFPAYSLDYARHREESIITAYLEGLGFFERMEPHLPAMGGDIVCFKIGKCIHHCGVMIGGNEFVHALERARVVVSRLDDSTWSKRLACFYRAHIPQQEVKS